MLANGQGQAIPVAHMAHVDPTMCTGRTVGVYLDNHADQGLGYTACKHCHHVVRDQADQHRTGQIAALACGVTPVAGSRPWLRASLIGLLIGVVLIQSLLIQVIQILAYGIPSSILGPDPSVVAVLRVAACGRTSHARQQRP